MYNFSYFKEKDSQKLVQFMHDHPFAFLTGSTTKGKQVATQVPIMVEERKGELFLQGHIMKNTDHHLAFMENPQVLIVFTGPHTYVSASWYTNPQLGSTWNYMSIHVRGTINFLSENGLIELMKKLTLRFENQNTESPTIYENLPDEFLHKMMPAITGFEIKVEELENVFKLSQNRDEKSYLNIIGQLEKQGGDAALIAKEMQSRKDALFPPGIDPDPETHIPDQITITDFEDRDFGPLLEMGQKLWKDLAKDDLSELISMATDQDKYKILIGRNVSQRYAGFAIFSIRTDYVEGAIKSPTGYLEGIFVESQFRKQGIAKEFLRIGETWCKEKGCVQIGSDTWLTHTESRKFHQRVGFWEEDELVHFLKKLE